jgi:eukaryotic-like serine/threonine-protein kinase
METGGRYTIYGKIASGGMASVHFGRQRGGEGFARTVAIKRLHPHLAEDPAFRATLIDEARMAARIHHPNVVPTLDVVSDEGELLVVMEYVRGESLSRLLREGHESEKRQVPLPIAAAIAVGALHGLHAAHEARSDRGERLEIVHRDVSPQNILVGTDGLARVIDFGVAKAAGRLQITREGTIKGKRPYMAPEQIAGGVVGVGADVYAMGVVLWEMLTARRLFPGENDAALAASVLAGAKEAPSAYVPGLGAELDALVMTALAVDPSDRFASALEMAETLVALVPPAMTTDVGRWVEDSAHDALAKRGALLAEIESGSHSAKGMETDARGETSTMLLGSQPSSISVETPRPQAAHRAGSRRTLAAVVAVGAVLASALVLAGSARGPRPNGVPAAIAPSVAPPPPQASSATAEPPPSPAGVSSSAKTSPAPAASPAPRPPHPRAPLAKDGSNCSVVTAYDKEGQPHFRYVCK